jgi:hypothetical protein
MRVEGWGLRVEGWGLRVEDLVSSFSRASGRPLIHCKVSSFHASEGGKIWRLTASLSMRITSVSPHHLGALKRVYNSFSILEKWLDLKEREMQRWVRGREGERERGWGKRDMWEYQRLPCFLYPLRRLISWLPSTIWAMPEVSGEKEGTWGLGRGWSREQF